MKITDKKIRHKWQPFEKARTFARNLNLKGQTEWKKWAKSKARPDDIPVNAYRTYKDKGWVSWGDWLGTERVANQRVKHREFSLARLFVHNLNLKNENEWKEWAKSNARPSDIPSDPRNIYKNKG